MIRRNPAISYGLSNLLENALDFAQTEVRVTGRWTDQQVTLAVADDGPGFDEAIMDRLGDPFVTTRPGFGANQPEPGERHEGMGLGLFIAQTLLQRSGATVQLSNRSAPETGATILISWPRSVFAAATKPA
jgi:two-component system sensor histidine kinase RegB